MIRDVWTVMYKEWRELAIWGDRRLALASLIGFAGLIGVLLPWQVGPGWITAPWMILFWTWLPFFLVTTVIADSFAGERERKTLETLLATRLPGRAILLGKIGAAVVWIWSATMACVVVGLVTVNLVHAPGGLPQLPHNLVIYEPLEVVGIAGIVALASIMGAGIGVLVSIRSSSVRQAQQILAVLTLFLFLSPLLILKALPEAWLFRVVELFMVGDMAIVALAVGAVFVALNAILLGMALTRYQRGRLLLD